MVFLRSAIEEINGFRFMIDKLEIQSSLAKRVLNTLPYLHTPEAIAQELVKPRLCVTFYKPPNSQTPLPKSRSN